MEKYKFIPTNPTIPNQDKLQLRLQEVDHIVDKLEMPIDPEIKEAIAILRTLDFPTISSCAGHTEPQRCGTPYISISTDPPEGWKGDRKKQEDWWKSNMAIRERMALLLEKFYFNRQAIPDAKLIMRNQGIYGAFVLESEGSQTLHEKVKIIEKDNIFSQIKIFQQEMNDFILFLKNKLLAPDVK